VGLRVSRGDAAPLLGGDPLHAPLRPDLRRYVGWEDILGLAVTIGLLWYLLRAMLRAERV
jgi:K+-transporting ATPase KdpF subunit